MVTPSLVIVGAPHFLSSTTLRPLGPRVTLTVSARASRPRSIPRRASSSKAMILGITAPYVTGGRAVPATDEPVPGVHVTPGPDPHLAAWVVHTQPSGGYHSTAPSASRNAGTLDLRVQGARVRPRQDRAPRCAPGGRDRPAAAPRPPLSRSCAGRAEAPRAGARRRRCRRGTAAPPARRRRPPRDGA